MASKIRELKDTVVAQNELVKTLRGDQKVLREVLHELYRGMVKYKPEFIASKTSFEDVDLPDIRGEDITGKPTHELVRRVGAVFGTVTQSLTVVREELREVYKELDGDVDAAIQTWQEIQINERNDKKAETFRADTLKEATRKRPETPELGARPTPSFGGTLPPTPPDAPGKKDIRPIATGKPSSGTTTLNEMLSPTAKTAFETKSGNTSGSTSKDKARK